MNNFPDDLIPLGMIIKPHGIKGQIKFKPYNENSSILCKNMEVWLKESKNDNLSFKFFKISSINYNSLYPIVQFDEIYNRDEALELKDYVLYVSRALFPDIKNEIYFVDLIGSKVYDINEKFIGIINDIVHFPGEQHIAIIELNSKEVMIPINNDLLKFFDIKKKHVVIDIADGLVDN